MQLIRAHELLSAIDGGQEVNMTLEEQEELRLQRSINVFDPGAYSTMAAEVREIDALAQSIRQETRAKDLSGPGAMGRFEPSVPKIEFRGESLPEKVARLEDLIGKKTLLESMVASRGTNSYVALAVSGRKTLAALGVWMTRFSESSFQDFLGKMDSMQASMAKAVMGAQIFMKLYESPEPDTLQAEVRAPALIASMRGTSPEKYIDVMERSLEHGGDASPPEDDLFDSEWSEESEDEWDSPYIEPEPPSIDMVNPDLTTSEENIKEVSIAGLPSEAASARRERTGWIQANMTLPDQGVIAWLAASPYPVEEVKRRYDQIMQALTALGYQEDVTLRSATGILAGSSYLAQDAASRFADLAGELKGVFEKPYVAAAMMAANSFTPRESMDIFKEAVGVVSRANYFDDVGEIETLALLLTNKVTPDFVVAAKEAPPAAQQTYPVLVSPEQPTDYYQARPVSWRYWYYWNSRHYYRPLISHVRTHPGHMHTVPYFG